MLILKNIANTNILAKIDINIKTILTQTIKNMKLLIQIMLIINFATGYLANCFAMKYQECYDCRLNKTDISSPGELADCSHNKTYCDDYTDYFCGSYAGKYKENTKNELDFYFEGCLNSRECANTTETKENAKKYQNMIIEDLRCCHSSNKSRDLNNNTIYLACNGYQHLPTELQEKINLNFNSTSRPITSYYTQISNIPTTNTYIKANTTANHAVSAHNGYNNAGLIFFYYLSYYIRKLLF